MEKQLFFVSVWACLLTFLPLSSAHSGGDLRSLERQAKVLDGKIDALHSKAQELKGVAHAQSTLGPIVLMTVGGSIGGLGLWITAMGVALAPPLGASPVPWGIGVGTSVLVLVPSLVVGGVLLHAQRSKRHLILTKAKRVDEQIRRLEQQRESIREQIARLQGKTSTPKHVTQHHPKGDYSIPITMMVMGVLPIPLAIWMIHNTVESFRQLGYGPYPESFILPGSLLVIGVGSLAIGSIWTIMIHRRHLKRTKPLATIAPTTPSKAHLILHTTF